MELNVKQSIVSRQGARLNLLVLLCVGLMVANILLAIGCIYAFSHKTTRYIPFGAERAFSMSSNRVSASYLNMMSQDLVGLIFNVTPKTVVASHKLALQMIAPDAYSHFVNVFEQDTDNIIQNQVASSFYITAIRVNPATLTTVVSGVLHRSVGERALPPVMTAYSIQFSYNGQLRVLSIVKEQKAKTVNKREMH